MHLAEDPTAELDDSPEYPSGLDPELREGINIVQDMLKLESSGNNGSLLANLLAAPAPFREPGFFSRGQFREPCLPNGPE